jgi:hypothetical protein
MPPGFGDEHLRGLMGQREFLARSTALGLTAIAASALIGADAPALSQSTPAAGDTLRANTETKALKDPRIWDWWARTITWPRCIPNTLNCRCAPWTARACSS